MLALLSVLTGLAAILTGSCVAFFAFLGWIDDYDGSLAALFVDGDWVNFAAATIAGAMTAFGGLLLILLSCCIRA